jgi:hypothetical protein
MVAMELSSTCFGECDLVCERNVTNHIGSDDLVVQELEVSCQALYETVATSTQVPPRPCERFTSHGPGYSTSAIWSWPEIEQVTPSHSYRGLKDHRITDQSDRQIQLTLLSFLWKAK